MVFGDNVIPTYAGAAGHDMRGDVEVIKKYLKEKKMKRNCAPTYEDYMINIALMSMINDKSIELFQTLNCSLCELSINFPWSFR